MAFISNVITFQTVLHLQLMGHGDETLQTVEVDIVLTVLYNK